jgi:hypothetical protein
MSNDNIISIEDLRKEFLAKQEPKAIKEFAHKQQELLEKYMKENRLLKERLDHLEKLTINTGKSLLINNDNDEEIICVEQINILKQRSSAKELDINDVKKLDLLIKNLRLIRSQPTDVIDTQARDLSQEELLVIAAGPNTETIK